MWSVWVWVIDMLERLSECVVSVCEYVTSTNQNIHTYPSTLSFANCAYCSTSQVRLWTLLTKEAFTIYILISEVNTMYWLCKHTYTYLSTLSTLSTLCIRHCTVMVLSITYSLTYSFVTPLSSYPSLTHSLTHSLTPSHTLLLFPRADHFIYRISYLYLDWLRVLYIIYKPGKCAHLKPFSDNTETLRKMVKKGKRGKSSAGCSMVWYYSMVIVLYGMIVGMVWYYGMVL